MAGAAEVVAVFGAGDAVVAVVAAVAEVLVAAVDEVVAVAVDEVVADAVVEVLDLVLAGACGPW